MDDQRFGTVIRTLRIKRGLRQVDLAPLCDVSRATISRAERGHIDTLPLRTIRAIAAALDVRVDLTPRWRAGDLDRLLNARHSGLHELVARHLADLPDWVAQPESRSPSTPSAEWSTSSPGIRADAPCWSSS